MRNLVTWLALTLGGALGMSLAPSAPAAVDTQAPVSDITFPPDSSSFSADVQAKVAGVSTDNVGVVRVETRLMSLDTELFWDGSGWVARDVWLPLRFASPGALSVDWSTQLPHATAGGYYLWVRATDAAGNVGAADRILFTTEVYPPETVVVTPRHGATVASPVNVQGTATDSRGVAGVRMAVRDRTTLKWWTGTEWGVYTGLPATLTDPRATSTSWRFSWVPPEPGDFLIQARAVDTSDNVDPTPVNRHVRVN